MGGQGEEEILRRIDTLERAQIKVLKILKKQQAGLERLVVAIEAVRAGHLPGEYHHPNENRDH